MPGNDDAARAIQLYCDLVADAVIDGLAAGQSAAGVDLGASEAPVEPALRAKAATAPAPVETPEAEPDIEAAAPQSETTEATA